MLGERTKKKTAPKVPLLLLSMSLSPHFCLFSYFVLFLMMKRIGTIATTKKRSKIVLTKKNVYKICLKICFVFVELQCTHQFIVNNYFCSCSCIATTSFFVILILVVFIKLLALCTAHTAAELRCL